MHYNIMDDMMNKLCTKGPPEQITNSTSANKAIDRYTLACLREETGNQNACFIIGERNL